MTGGCCSLYFAAEALLGKESRMDTNYIAWLGRHIGNVDASVVHLFGGPYITVASERQEIPEGSKQLLAFVTLRQRRVERCKAAGALWPSGDEGRAAGNLRSALWRLRCQAYRDLVRRELGVDPSRDLLTVLRVPERGPQTTTARSAAGAG